MKTNEFTERMRQFLTPSDYKTYFKKINSIKPEHRIAFETLIKYGYAVDLAFDTLVPLYEYVNTHPAATYADTVKVILTVNKGFDYGVKIRNAMLGIHEELCELTLLERHLIISLTVTTPYEFKELHALYTRTKSFDKTIYLVEKGQQLATPLLVLAEFENN